MATIKTVQPYKLYKKILKDKSSAKWSMIGVLALFIIMALIEEEPALFLIPLILILITLPLVIYNPTLKKEYEPGKSYSWVKEYATTGIPTFVSNALKFLAIAGWIVGLLLDILDGEFPLCTLIAGGSFSLIAYLIKKNPKRWMSWNNDIQMQNHQDVDYNVKVDLNDIYGVNDKLIMSYQNFGYEKENMDDGDYLLGVSAQGVYFVSKNQTVTKTKINFGEIDTLGLLAAIGNVYVFNIISTKNVEINMIIDQNKSLMVHPVMLFNTLLNSLDSYIQNGGVVPNSNARRRRVSVSTDDTKRYTNNTSAELDSQRSIDLDESKAQPDTIEEQKTSNKRVIEISYTNGVLEEMAAASFVESNRKIEL